LRKIGYIIIVGIMALGFSALFAAQKSAQDKKPTAEGKKNEIVLDEILIEGRLEKPNVTILPNRATTPFEESAFPERSFNKEIQALLPESLLFGAEFDRNGVWDNFSELSGKQTTKRKQDNISRLIEEIIKEDLR